MLTANVVKSRKNSQKVQQPVKVVWVIFTILGRTLEQLSKTGQMNFIFFFSSKCVIQHLFHAASLNVK